MKSKRPDFSPDIANFFPGQMKVYNLGSSSKDIDGNSPSLLNKHFKEPLSEETMDRLVREIAFFLQDQEETAVYSFFYRTRENVNSVPAWFLSFARLNKCDKGFPKELVIFTYDLQFLGDSRGKLYRFLEDDDFFKDHFDKVSTLTKREKEIIRLLASGMNSTGIAAAMCISIHTVIAHRKNINEKLDVQNIAGLLKFAEVFDLATNQTTT